MKFIFVAFLFSLSIEAQSKLDSLKNIIDNIGDNERIKILEEIVNESYEKRINKDVIQYGDELIKLFAEEGQQDSTVGAILRIVGISHRKLANYEKALSYYERSLEVFEKLNSQRNVAKVLGSIGILHDDQGNYQLAYESHMKSLEIFEKLGDKENIGVTNNELALVFEEMGDYEKALEFHFKALEIRKILDNKNSLAITYNNIGVTYESLGDLDKALYYQTEAMKIAEELNDEIGVAYAEYNIGLLNEKLNKLDEALKDYNKAWDVFEKNDYKLESIYPLRGIGSIYTKIGRHNDALEKLNKALAIAKEIDAKSEIELCYKKLFEAYEAKNDYKNALKYNKLYEEIKDSIFTKEKVDKIQELQTKYETEKKEQENLFLKAELEHKSTQQIFYISIVALVLLLAGVLYYVNRIIMKKNRLLKELNATKDKFFSIIAHDLKNPFGTLLSFSEILENDLETSTPEENYEAINAMKNAAYSGYQLLENLLEWAKTQTGKIKFSPENISLSDIINDNIELLSAYAKKKKIDLSHHSDEGISLYADKNMLSTVIRNITSNAIKFTEEGGKVEVFSSRKNSSVEIVIQDNGVGINKADQEKLFKIDGNFSTKGTAKEEGTGLGLIICKEFIKKHGGTISVESQSEKGSKFIIRIPQTN